MFKKGLNEFPEFTDEVLNDSMNAFHADLRYWASCLKVYKGQFGSRAVQRYLHDLCGEMNHHLDAISSPLRVFLKIGIPTSRSSQKHAEENLIALTTVSTFFSGVTATTLQFSFENVGSPVANAVNSFWFISLVFSISGTVNSLLCLTWKKAIYRSPESRVPWWAFIWISRSPIVLLVLSVVAFSLGLCLFAYSSGQNLVTSTFTTILTSLSSLGLVTVSLWFMLERWAYSRYEGERWLTEIVEERLGNVTLMSIRGWFSNWSSNPTLGRFWEDWGVSCIRGLFSELFSILRLRRFWGNGGTLCPREGNDPEKQHEAVPTPFNLPSSSGASPGSLTVNAVSVEPPVSTTFTSRGGPKRKDCDTHPTSPDPADTRAPGTTVLGSELLLPAVRRRAIKAIWRHVDKERFQLHGEKYEEYALQASSVVGVVRAMNRIPALKNLQPSFEIQQHSALVRHLQFSPNGNFLATCSWDRTCLIFNVEDFTRPHHVLGHPQGFVSQIAWSPKGDYLLTRMSDRIKIWTTADGVCLETIKRGRQIQSISWFPQDEAFLSVESDEVLKLDLEGKKLRTYRLPRMILHDVAITNDQERMLCVGTLVESEDGLKPSKSREGRWTLGRSREEKQLIVRSKKEKRVIVYNLVQERIEYQAPTLHDVRNITLARNGTVALVSYKNEAPPQLWKLEVGQKATLSLVHTYMPRPSVRLVGPSHFGGNDDQLVLCADKDGNIHVWDGRTSYFLHSYARQEFDDDLVCIAWRRLPVSSPFMFATGSRDGTVRIWEPMTEQSVTSRTSLQRGGSDND